MVKDDRFVEVRLHFPVFDRQTNFKISQTEKIQITRVVLLEPVSPHMKITSLLFTASNIFPSSDKLSLKKLSQQRERKILDADWSRKK